MTENKPETKNDGQLLIIEPLGPQGPKVGIRIREVGDVIVLDAAMGELTEKERKTVMGILSAAERAGLDVVDCSPLPDKQKLDSID